MWSQPKRKVSNVDPELTQNALTVAKDILQRLGIIGEIGSKDIINVVDYMITHRDTASDMTLIELCAQFSDNPIPIFSSNFLGDGLAGAAAAVAYFLTSILSVT